MVIKRKWREQDKAALCVPFQKAPAVPAAQLCLNLYSTAQKELQETLDSHRLAKADFINRLRRDKDKMETIKVHARVRLEGWIHLGDKKTPAPPKWLFAVSHCAAFVVFAHVLSDCALICKT